MPLSNDRPPPATARWVDRLRRSFRRHYALVTIVLGLGLVGCAGWGRSPEPQYDSDGTRDLLATLYGVNDGLVAGKWIGKVSLTYEGTRRTFDRVAWAGAEPGQVRFDARTPFGMPVLSLACNESHLTAVAHSRGEYFRRQVGTSRLGRYFPVDISCQDLYRLMTGRPPLVDYHAARLESAEEGATIHLERRFRGTVARLFVDADSGMFMGAELLDVHGNRRYKARLVGSRRVEGFRLPHQLHLEGAQGGLDLEANRLFPNRPVAPSLFEINPPP